MLGLKHDVNLLVDHDPQWETDFIEERGRISHALGVIARGIEHYGSTAVKGMRAKPILDIMVGVAPFEDWQKCKAPLERLGYDYAANAGVLRHHIFGRGRDSPSALIWFTSLSSWVCLGAPTLSYVMPSELIQSCGMRMCEKKNAQLRRHLKVERNTMSRSSPSSPT